MPQVSCTATAVVWLEVRGEDRYSTSALRYQRDDGGLAARLIEFLSERQIAPATGGVLQPGDVALGFYPHDAAKVIAWLEGQGVTVRRS